MAPVRAIRLAGAAALVASAAGFLVGLVALYRAEGPNSPDLNIYLSDAAGQADLVLMVFALTAAVVLFLIGIRKPWLLGSIPCAASACGR